MGLIYRNDDKLRIDAGKSVSFPAVQSIYGRMTANDMGMVVQDVAPGVWLNPLYPGVNTDGYSKGQAVWLNVYNIDDFVAKYQADIEAYARHDTQLAEMFDELSSDGKASEKHELCRKVVEGFGSDGPLYYLGDPLAPAEIMVSLSDSNVKPPTDDKWWKPFIKRYNAQEARDQMLSVFGLRVENAFVNHLVEYHLSGQYNSSEQLYEKYLLRDASNVKGQQRFKSHYWFQPTTEGYDRVKFYDQRATGTNRMKWTRVWESGLVEHGGVVSLDQPDNGDTYRDGVYNVSFSRAVHGNRRAPSYNYPIPGFQTPYGDEEKYSANGTTYDLPEMAFNPQMSYVVKVTPVNPSVTPYQVYNSQARAYDQADVCFVTNEGFSFVPADTRVKLYSYLARGHSQQARKF